MRLADLKPGTLATLADGRRIMRTGAIAGWPLVRVIGEPPGAGPHAMDGSVEVEDVEERHYRARAAGAEVDPLRGSEKRPRGTAGRGGKRKP